MNKKNTIKKTAALMLGLALTVGATGCNFIVTDSEKDLAQTVAEVDISKGLDGNDAVKTDLAKIVGTLSASISKRDLVAYFLSTGYEYVESYGYTYEATFNMLLDGLVSREIMIQNAIKYYLEEKETYGLTLAGCEAYLKAQGATDATKELYTLKYFLTEDGKKIEKYDSAEYSLKKSLNDSLDSLEANYITAESEEHDHTDDETRTLPTNVGTEKEDYYNTEYNVYTGRNTLDDCEGYEKVEGSKTSTRQKAYNAFLANLQSYNMIGADGKEEDTSDVTKLSYYSVELCSVLGQALINKYFEDMESEVTDKLTEVGEDGKSYVQEKYDSILADQKQKYATSPSSFSTAMDGVSDDAFLLYGLKDFGFVYNILIPFSASQNVAYTTAKNNTANTQDDLYNIRKDILKQVKAKDLRGSWISNDDHVNYSTKKDDGLYYFFQDQIGESAKYETIRQYAGTYAYQGTFDEETNKATPDEITLDSFIQKFEKHINDTVDATVAAKDTTWTSTYDAENSDTDYYNEKTKEVEDYSKFVYYKGKTNITATAKDYFDPTSDIYKAISAVNEFMFTYSTDPGCLNTYFGYAVSPYGTDFVKEFEYAAQEAVKGGAGTYVVVATDYGWHIVYASFVYGEGGDVYGGYNESEKDKEGTFSNMFYESLKATASSSYTTERQNEVLNLYNNDTSVTRYQERYQDLLDLA